MIAIDMEQTGKNIENFMEKNNMTPRDMQSAFGFGTVNTIYTWIRGKKIPNIDNMVQIADMFGIKIDDIIAVKQI